MKLTLIKRLDSSFSCVYSAAPSTSEWEYVNRNGYHSVNVQLMCDAILLIRNAVIR